VKQSEELAQQLESLRSEKVRLETGSASWSRNGRAGGRASHRWKIVCAWGGRHCRKCVSSEAMRKWNGHGMIRTGSTCARLA